MACTQYNHTLLKLKTGVPQDRVLSPSLLNNYTSDIPLSLKDLQITMYTDDLITSHTKHHKAQQLLQLYLEKTHEYTTNNHHINPDKLQLCFLHKTQLKMAQLNHFN